MAKQTKRDRVIEHITGRGAVELESSSRKYRKFTRPEGGANRPYWFVGKSGALRTGRIASDSRSVTSFLKAEYGI